MVAALFDNKFLGYYLLTLKLKEILGTGIPSSNEFPEEPLQSEWVISIKEKLEQARQDEVPSSWPKISIYKIPRPLRETGGDDKAYVPQIVSLGSYHHGKSHLCQMDRHKWRSLNHVLKRTEHDISLYLNSMKEMEERARCCYEGPICLSSNEFVEMLVLDGCFVLELFRVAIEGFQKLGYSRNDPIFEMRGSMHSIQRDMIMLENQLPLFVLDRLLGIQLGNPEQKGLVANLAINFFNSLMPLVEPLTESDRNKLKTYLERRKLPFYPSSGGLHCLDVFRTSLLRKKPQPSPRTGAREVSGKVRQEMIHCVTELREAGIKFRKRTTDSFWDIEFKDGILRIPTLLIDDGTKSLFLNLIAFEQCHLDCGNDITSYASFMDNLINSPADVGYLHYRGIIDTWLGSDDEVADLFNRLCQEVVFDVNNSYLSELSEDVNTYYKQRWNTWYASLRHNYFSNPWAIISLVAAVILLLLTFAQTYYTYMDITDQQVNWWVQLQCSNRELSLSPYPSGLLLD